MFFLLRPSFASKVFCEYSKDIERVASGVVRKGGTSQKRYMNNEPMKRRAKAV
jgi:hypothetical protein